MAKVYLILSIIFFSSACQNDSSNLLPKLHFDENESKRFIYTNKGSGFFVGNSHQLNSRKWEGWYVDSTQYLLDYEIFTGSQLVNRDSVEQFTYHPYSFQRKYGSGLNETVTLLDSIHAIVWEFESGSNITDLQFKPIFGKSRHYKQELLSNHIPQIIIPSNNAKQDSLVNSDSWVGINYYKINDNKVVVVAVLEKNKKKVINLLHRLVQEYSALVQVRINRMSQIILQNQTYTNIPEITDAIKWSQLSLNALISENKPSGIQSGLPAKLEFLGRDTFISLAGALLVNGQFPLAKKILTYFSEYQLQNEEDPWYGRIPSEITLTEVDYNSADVTWWYIRALYQYLLFSGDREFLRDIFPVVKHAIDGAIRFRIDENFYLVHKENETWMDQSDGQILLSARGNRAVEIQSLWYTALLIGSKLASWSNDPNLEEYWYTIAQSLKENFQTDFWKPFRNRMHDYLDANGSPNRSIRPNILFAGSASQLPEIQPLINDDIKSQVINTVMNKLTFRYGTSTLWQEDRNFIPTNFDHSSDLNPGNHHNGSIWHWLSGPLITNLLYFNLDEVAFYLYSYESNQILYEDAIGNFASFRDPHPIPKKESVILKKNLSSSMSLAEYVRNFYQDFIGYNPNAINQHIALTPIFPSDLKYVSTNLPYANGWIHFQFSEEENLFLFEISKEGDMDKINIEFQYPGFDRKRFLLNEMNTSIKITLDPTSRKSYSRYNELDWHFAQWE